MAYRGDSGTGSISGMNGGAGGGSVSGGNWFNQVTGTTERERQSWRDSFNGGRAAGDLTGNTNARLDRERQAFGTTWGGSSSAPSAIELARAGGHIVDYNGGIRDFHNANIAGPAAHTVTTGTGRGEGEPRARMSGAGTLRINVPAGSGPGHVGAGHSGQGRPGAPPSGGPRRTDASPWITQQTPPDYVPDSGDWFIPMSSPEEVAGRPLPFGPIPWEGSPYIPSAQTLEDEVGEAEFLSPGWFANWGAAIGNTAWNVERAANATMRNLDAAGFNPSTPYIGGDWIRENVRPSNPNVERIVGGFGYSDRFNEIPGGF